MQKNNLSLLIPIMFTFFVMGFVDLVGTASNYIQHDFGLSNSQANFFPGMVFFWFLIFSVPTGALMSRVGRRKTVLLSLVITAASLLIPIVQYSYASMFVSFALLGIGNTLMQVSLNPLISNVVRGEKLASTLTAGQFVKAIASFMAPIIMSQAALRFENWRLVFPIFMVFAVIAVVWLGMTSIKEEDKNDGEKKSASFRDCFLLLGNPLIFFFFLGIVCHVGIDVGINTISPKILQERLGSTVQDASYATVVYFIFRTMGCFAGAFILARFSPKKFFLISVLAMVLSMTGLFIFHSKELLYLSIALVGFGNSNIFPITFSQALLHLPNKKDEVSGLMIMGLFGGTLFPVAMGCAADALHSQNGAIAVLCIGVAYLLFMTSRLKGTIQSFQQTK